MPARSGGGRPTAYKLDDGTRVPSVTTITKRFADSGGLIRWAHQMGIEGKDMDAERDEAADAGRLAHAMIENIMTCRGLREGIEKQDAETEAKAACAVDAFLSWKTQVKLEVLETEMPLVSHEHRFGGTFDALARIDGRIATLDWKSSKRVYADMIIQQAGYSLLIEECYHDERTPEGVALLRIGKEFADFHYHFYPKPVIDLARKAFLSQRALYEIDKQLGRLL